MKLSPECLGEDIYFHYLLFVNDLDKTFKYYKFLLFTDNLKLYNPINTPNYCLELQDDIDHFSEWCSMNKLNINVNKCQQITFSRRTNPIQFSYQIHNVSLNVVSSVKDLGVWLSSVLSFNLHLDKMYKKALKVPIRFY